MCQIGDDLGSKESDRATLSSSYQYNSLNFESKKTSVITMKDHLNQGLVHSLKWRKNGYSIWDHEGGQNWKQKYK